MDAGQFQFAADFAKKGRLVVGFEIGGERFDLVVPRDGRAIPLVLAGELEDMMDLFHATMRKDSFERFEDLVYDFDAGLEVGQVRLLYHHAITLLSGGQPYWVTQVLVASAHRLGMQFLGDPKILALRPLGLPLHEFVSLVYAYLTDGADKEGREKFDAELNRPPAGADAELIAEQPEWKNAGQDFMASLAARGAR